MRENCTYGSEGGEGREPLPDPYQAGFPPRETRISPAMIKILANRRIEARGSKQFLRDGISFEAPPTQFPHSATGWPESAK